MRTAAPLLAEGHHDRAPHLRVEGEGALGEGLVVEGQAEGEALPLGGEVPHREEGLRVVGAEVVAAHREARDAHVVGAAAHPGPAHPHVVALRLRGLGVRPVGEDVDLGPRIRADQGPRGAEPLREAVRQVVPLHGPEGGGHPVVLAGERHHHLRLHARLDHHHLGALAQAPEQPQRGPLRLREARRRDVGGLHGRRGVHDDGDPLRPLPHHGHRGPGQRDGEREQGQDLQDQERIALQALEEGGGLAVAQGRLPEQEARDRHLPAAHLQEVQEQQRHREGAEQQRERAQEVHASSSPLSWRSMNSSTGLSVTTR